jgi:hypothetical protein
VRAQAQKRNGAWYFGRSTRPRSRDCRDPAGSVEPSHSFPFQPTRVSATNRVARIRCRSIEFVFRSTEIRSFPAQCPQKYELQPAVNQNTSPDVHQSTMLRPGCPREYEIEASLWRESLKIACHISLDLVPTRTLSDVEYLGHRPWSSHVFPRTLVKSTSYRMTARQFASMSAAVRTSIGNPPRPGKLGRSRTFTGYPAGALQCGFQSTARDNLESAFWRSPYESYWQKC